MKKEQTPPKIPIKIPTITSVGKWINRYNLEIATKAANTMAGTPHFLFLVKIAIAPAKEAPECPEGKEKSSGMDTPSTIGTSVKIQNGLLR